MSTSLIAAWIKKQRFVERINEIDKYLLNINSLCEELEVQFLLLEKDRLPYKEFKDKYIPEITKYVTTNPLIPPKYLIPPASSKPFFPTTCLSACLSLIMSNFIPSCF